MLRLTEAELDNALHALEKHGYGDFFPAPPEFSLVKANWDTIRGTLSQIDLDIYDGYPALLTFAPKSRVNVRRVALLHPYDLILYTALVLALRDGLSRSRQAVGAGRVFSYQAEAAPDDALYNDNPSYRDFREAVVHRIRTAPESYVGITDIADFYPRIYQHRLVNALQAANGASRFDHIRMLEKMLNRLSENVSYGIPIGPGASRPLGEAVLIDVDSTLLSYGIDFVRFTDDYVIFAEKPEDAEYGIRVLGETLFVNHGLTLQTAKTRVLGGADYDEIMKAAEKAANEQGRRLN